jgi:hypothetical protein
MRRFPRLPNTRKAPATIWSVFRIMGHDLRLRRTEPSICSMDSGTQLGDRNSSLAIGKFSIATGVAMLRREEFRTLQDPP